jgi:transcriptional regulator with XRE-family HTH domain
LPLRFVSEQKRAKLVGERGFFEQLCRKRSFSAPRACNKNLRFCYVSGVGVTTIIRIERNQVEPQASTIRKLANALDVEPHELLKGAGDG